jgi:hypothetical protein
LCRRQSRLRRIVQPVDPQDGRPTIAASRNVDRYPDSKNSMGDAMGNHGKTIRLLCTYVMLLIVGQATAVGIGLLLDPVSKSAALATFIPIYYAMYWVAWRLALLIVDRAPQSQHQAPGSSGAPIKLAAWLLAPAVLAFDAAE